MEEPLNWGKSKKVKSELEQQIVNFFDFKSYEEIDPHCCNLLVIELVYDHFLILKYNSYILN